LYKTSCAGNYTAVKVDGVGNFNSQIMLVGEALGAQEVREKKPFVGESGRLLRKNLQSVGIDEKNAYFTNICRCRPPSNATPTKEEIGACLPYLVAEIQEMKPKVIGALGGTVCKSLGIVEKITGIHGAKIWNEKYCCWIIPIYHPAYVMRFTRDARQRREFLQDLGLLKKLENASALKEEQVNYKIADTPEKIRKATQYLLQQDWFTFDIETNMSNNYLISKIPCISFSAKPKTAIIIPYQHPKVFNELQQQEVKKYLCQIMGSKVKKIAQYGKFDILNLLAQNIPVSGFAFDTMLAHYLLDEEGIHNLGTLLKTYTDMPAYKDMMTPYFVSKQGNGINEVIEAPLETLYEYSGKDADGTLRLFLVLKKLLSNEGLDYLFYKIVMPLTYVLAKMELKGIAVDKDYVLKQMAFFKYKLRELSSDLQANKIVNTYVNRKYTEALNNASPRARKKPQPEPFNFNSPKQLAELLYSTEYLNIKPIKFNKPTKTKPKGSPSTDNEVLTTLTQTTKYKLLEDLMQYRRTKKLQDYIRSYEELATNSVDGRIHTTYHQARFRDHGTVTGRLASSNPNLQNNPSASRDPENASKVRNCLIAKPGYTLIEADFGQIEFRVWAHCSNDAAMISDVNNPDTDIHKRVAATVNSIPYEAVTKKQRALAKEVVYGLMYGRGTYSIAMEYGITQGEAERIKAGFFSTYPVAAQWIESNIEFVRKNGYITNIFGRKRRLDGIFSTNKTQIAYAERQTRNFPLQSGAADLIYLAMIKLFKKLENYPNIDLLLQIHDSVVVEAADDQLQEAIDLIDDCMKTAIKLKINLTVDFKVGKKFGEMV